MTPLDDAIEWAEHAVDMEPEREAKHLRALLSAARQQKASAESSSTAAIEQDAARYRWLREAGCNIRDEDSPAEWYEGDEMDAAIDDALAQAKPK